MGEDEKRGPNMGSRSTVRHGAQGVATSGGIGGILQALVSAGYVEVNHAFLALMVLTPLATTAWKLWDGLDGMARLKALLNRVAPLSLVLLMASGCAIQLGTMEPKQFSTLGGGTLIACDVKGISIAVGDADLCSNSARGGKVSKTFSDMTLGVVKTAGAAIAGFFGGAGQGMAQALQAQPDPEPEAAVSAPAEPVDFGNPFTEPE